MEQHKPDLTRKRFGQRLRRWRERRHLSLDDVATMTAAWSTPITRSSLARFESGEVLPALNRLTVLARALDIPLVDLAARYGLESRIAAARPEPGADLIRLARERMRAGLWIEHLAFISLAQDRLVVGPKQADYDQAKCLKLLEIQALLQLRYREMAKSELEVVLSDYRLTLDEQIGAWQLFTVACFRLRRLQLANFGLGHVEALLKVEGAPSRARSTTPFLRATFKVAIGNAEAAIPDYEFAIRVFEHDGDDFQASAARVSLADTRLAAGHLSKARSAVEDALAGAQLGGFDQHRANALSVLARISQRLRKFNEAESYAHASNELAVATEYWDVCFRNHMVLRDTARAAGDPTLVVHCRALRTYSSRVDPYLAEFQKFKAENRMAGENRGPVHTED